VREDTTFLISGGALYTLPALPSGTEQVELNLGSQVGRLQVGRP